MAKRCSITGRGTATGNHVAHCNKKVKRSFKVNLRWKRFWLAAENRFIRLRVSNRGMRIIDKKGIEVVLAQLQDKSELI